MKGTLAMYPNHAARELGVLLRLSQEIDVVGDLTAIVSNPSELLAWASTLAEPTVVAWQATDSGRRYVQVTAAHRHAPIRGRVSAVLHCEHHPEFWRELTADHDVTAGRQVSLTLKDLSRAWDVMPVAPPTT